MSDHESDEQGRRATEDTPDETDVEAHRRMPDEAPRVSAADEIDDDVVEAHRKTAE